MEHCDIIHVSFIMEFDKYRRAEASPWRFVFYTVRQVSSS